MYNQVIFCALASFIIVGHSFPTVKEEIDSHDNHESDSMEATPHSFEYSIDGRVTVDEKSHHDNSENDESTESYGTPREGAEYKIDRNDDVEAVSENTGGHSSNLQKREERLDDEHKRNQIAKEIPRELTRLIEHHEGIYRQKQFRRPEHRSQDDDIAHNEKIHRDEPIRHRQSINYRETTHQHESDHGESINRHHSIGHSEIVDQKSVHH